MTDLEKLDDGEALVARLDGNGKQVIARVIGGDATAQAIIEAEKPREATSSTEDPVQMLARIVAETAAEERCAIVESILGYAKDCQDRSSDLEGSTRRERARLETTGHHEESERIGELMARRIGAFMVRAAIAADIAHKIESFWGRDGASTDVDSTDVIREAAKTLDS